MKIIAFFNNKGGVGKTTLVYHIAWMYAELGQSVLAVDLDPQANLTTMFLDEDQLQTIWPEHGENQSIQKCIQPIIDGVGDIASAPLQSISPLIHLLPGDLGLSLFEDKLSASWPLCMDGDQAAFRSITSLYRILYYAAEQVDSDIVLMDVGPNLGAINRAALIASDFVVTPLAPGLFSMQGLKNLGPTLELWRTSWQKRLQEKPDTLSIPMPSGNMQTAGYVIMQHVERKNRPVKAFQRWIARVPEIYSEHILRKPSHTNDAQTDINCIGFIKNYQSLMPLAEDARKPIFKLTPADGAIGAHSQAVSKCYMDFQRLTQELELRTRASTDKSLLF